MGPPDHGSASGYRLPSGCAGRTGQAGVGCCEQRTRRIDTRTPGGTRLARSGCWRDRRV